MIDLDCSFIDKNQFEAISSADDDYSDLVEAVEQITCKITLGPKPYQKLARATGLSRANIAAIATDVNDGKITMPQLDLPTNADYTAVWALVDSGSPVHIADAKKVFPNAANQPPPPGHRGFQGAGGGGGGGGGGRRENVLSMKAL